MGGFAPASGLPGNTHLPARSLWEPLEFMSWAKSCRTAAAIFLPAQPRRRDLSQPKRKRARSSRTRAEGTRRGHRVAPGRARAPRLGAGIGSALGLE